METVHLRTVSFRILIHAELESFLEDRALELLEIAWDAWKNEYIPSRVVIALIAFSGVATLVPPGKLGGDGQSQKAYQDLREPIEKAQRVWRTAHKANHGVKEENVLALLLPLGIPPEELDPTLLADLTSYGADRGAVAHSSSLKMQQYADPRIEHQRAEQLIQSMTRLDQAIDARISEVRKSRAALTPTGA